MKYRSRTDIIFAILEASTEYISKTQIMYRSFLSFSQTREYLDYLTKEDLMGFDPKTNLYRITERGRKAIGIFNKINDLVPIKDTASLYV